MSLLIPIRYGKRHYPAGIRPSIQEVAAHFDVKSIKPDADYSLHTEYSYGARDFISPCLDGLEIIRSASKKGVPQLWRDGKWADEFAVYLERLVGGQAHPSIIEIHPPFDDYCPSVGEFLEIYARFERAIEGLFPRAKIFLENRAGSVYSGGKFLISTAKSLQALADGLSASDVAGVRNLGVVLDLPQLFTAHHFEFPHVPKGKIQSLFRNLTGIRNHIKGIHLWGKKANATGRTVAHQGDLDDYFRDPGIKTLVLGELNELLDDGVPRYFVPEVNSNDKDMASIIRDLSHVGFRFTGVAHESEGVPSV